MLRNSFIKETQLFRFYTLTKTFIVFLQTYTMLSIKKIFAIIAFTLSFATVYSHLGQGSTYVWYKLSVASTASSLIRSLNTTGRLLCVRECNLDNACVNVFYTEEANRVESCYLFNANVSTTQGSSSTNFYIKSGESIQ